MDSEEKQETKEQEETVEEQESYTDVRINGVENSEEEYQYIIRLINEAAMQNVHFYLGGRRDVIGRD